MKKKIKAVAQLIAGQMFAPEVWKLVVTEVGSVDSKRLLVEVYL